MTPALILLIATLGQVAAQEGPAKEDVSGRAERLTYLTERATEFQLFVKGDQAIRMTPQPVFRWSHPIAKLEDAAVFLWMDDEEPVALGTMILHSELGLFSEFQSVSSESLKAVKKNVTVWEPAQKGCEFSPVPDAPKPAGAAAERLTQMKMLSRRFAVELTKGLPAYSEESTWQLRLLPKQLARFGGPKAAALDGAIFVFCHDTDPEVILLLKASDAAWEFACAPLTGWEAKVKCDGKVVWSQPRLNPVDDPKRSYIKFGPEPVRTKFGSQNQSK